VRADDYGGDLKNRLRFPLEVAQAVRAAWPDEKPLAVALCADDWEEGGLSPGEAVTAARELHRVGVDLFEILAGQTTAGSRPVYGPGFLTNLSDYVRHEAGIPTMVGGYLRTSGDANSILAAGRADLCIFEEDV
jgi:anthraniloyl-CoA monooxygenase